MEASASEQGLLALLSRSESQPGHPAAPPDPCASSARDNGALTVWVLIAWQEDTYGELMTPPGELSCCQARGLIAPFADGFWIDLVSIDYLPRGAGRATGPR